MKNKVIRLSFRVIDDDKYIVVWCNDELYYGDYDVFWKRINKSYYVFEGRDYVYSGVLKSSMDCNKYKRWRR